MTVWSFAKFDKSEHCWSTMFPLIIAFFQTIITWSNHGQIFKSWAVLESLCPKLQDSLIESKIWWSFKGVMKGFHRLLGCWVIRPATVYRSIHQLRSFHQTYVPEPYSVLSYQTIDIIGTTYVQVTACIAAVYFILVT